MVPRPTQNSRLCNNATFQAELPFSGHDYHFGFRDIICLQRFVRATGFIMEWEAKLQVDCFEHNRLFLGRM